MNVEFISESAHSFADPSSHGETHVKQRILVICSLFAVILLSACDEESGADESGDQAADVEGLGKLGVVAESQADGMVTINQGSDHQIEFCYAGGGCEGQAAALGSAANIGGEGVTSVLSSSDPDRPVIGARVAFEVEGDGEAVVTIGIGTLHVDDEGVVPREEFEFEEILETTDTLRDGDVISIEVGEVE